MKFSLASFIHWTPKVLSSVLVLIALTMVLVYGEGSYLVGGIVIWTILFITTLISWRIAPIGGGMFMVFGSGYLLFAIGSMLAFGYILIALPFYLIGGMFIADYAYQEKQEEEGEDDF